MVAFVHTYFFSRIYISDSRMYYGTYFDLFDVLIPFSILFSIIFAQKIGKVVLIDAITSPQINAAMSVMRITLVKVILCTIIIFIFTAKGLSFDTIINYDFFSAILGNFIMAYLSGFGAGLLLTFVKEFFFSK